VALAGLLLLGCGGHPGGQVSSFVTRDGFQLTAEEFGTGSKGVVLAPAEDTDRTSWSGLARTLASEGLHVLTFDFRGYGSSQGERNPAQGDRDVAAAAQFMRSHGAQRVVLVGASAAGLACLKAAGLGMTAGVATLSAPPEYMGLTVGSEIVSLLIPKLYMASEGDAPAISEGNKLLAVSAEPRDLKTYPGSARGAALLRDPRAASDLSEFVQGALR
jgi:pimeloyl-ACP methyl ester carboxylesterase